MLTGSLLSVTRKCIIRGKGPKGVHSSEGRCWIVIQLQYLKNLPNQMLGEPQRLQQELPLWEVCFACTCVFLFILFLVVSLTYLVCNVSSAANKGSNSMPFHRSSGSNDCHSKYSTFYFYLLCAKIISYNMAILRLLVCFSFQ
jgi:hypothetical protein